MVSRLFSDCSYRVCPLTTVQVYLDNPTAVNEILVKELEKEYEKREP